MRKVAPLVFAIAILFALTARGRVVLSLELGPGRDLLAACTAEGKVGSALCGGYVMGVLDAKRPQPPGIPRSFSVPQAIDAVVQYLQAHPEKLDERSTDLIMLAVIERFEKG